MRIPRLIIPVKPLIAGKSRLEGVLEPEERILLNQKFLDHLLSVAEVFPGTRLTTVVSRDVAVLATAQSHGIDTVSETEDAGLNAALDQALAVVDENGPADDVLIVHADLPNVISEDLRAMCQLPIALAPDSREEGTNALFMAAPHRLPFRFGADSLRRHCEEARKLGLEPNLVRRPGLAFDVDTSDDLTRLGGAPRR